MFFLSKRCIVWTNGLEIKVLVQVNLHLIKITTMITRSTELNYRNGCFMKYIEQSTLSTRYASYNAIS